MDWASRYVEKTQIIVRPPEAVFAFLADADNETRWNVCARRIARVSAGAIGQGTRYQGSYVNFGELEIELIQYEWPRRLQQRRRCAAGEFRYTYVLEPARGGTWFWQHGEFTPARDAAFLAPLMGALMDWHLRALVRGIECHLESEAIAPTCDTSGSAGVLPPTVHVAGELGVAWGRPARAMAVVRDTA